MNKNCFYSLLILLTTISLVRPSQAFLGCPPAIASDTPTPTAVTPPAFPILTKAPVAAYHTPVLGYTFDVGSAAGRILSSAVKYFLGDNTKLEADLVWKKGSDSNGCGGCYKDQNPEATNQNLDPKLVFSDISLDENIYRDGETIGTACMAQRLLEDCDRPRAALEDLNKLAWETQYQAQRRSIQALTDALNMKRLYNNIKDVATSTPNDYSDYTKAMSTVASKRLLLDQLLALKKRIVAARVRVRAQTLQLNSVDLKLVPTMPNLELACIKENK